MSDALNEAQEPEDDLAFSQTQQVPSQSTRPRAAPISDHLYGCLVPSNTQAGLQRFDLRRDHISTPYTFGRQKKCDFVIKNKKVGRFELPESADGNQVSSLHCRIWMETDNGLSDGRVLVEDLSSNGLFVEGAKLGKGKRTQLDSGFEISFGPPSTELTEDLRFIFRTTPKGCAYDLDPSAAGGLYQYYDIRDTIGKGSFATVKRAIERSTGNLKAVKIMQKKRFLNNPKTYAMLEREVEIMKALNHPHIARYEDYFEDGDMMYIVMEYYTIRSNGVSKLIQIALSWMSTQLCEDEQTGAEIARQICLAVDYLHRSGVCHRDLKPDNVLLTNGDSPLVKISDFGLAKMVDNMTFLRTACGTPTYLAPEVVLQTGQSGYSFAVDAWSVGVIVYAILSNASPFEEDSQENLAARMQRREPDMLLLRNMGISDAGQDFVRRLMTVDPTQRMTVGDALEHAWLKAARTRHESSGSISLLPPNHAQAISTATAAVPSNTTITQTDANWSLGASDVPYSQQLHDLRLDGSTSRPPQSSTEALFAGPPTALVEDSIPFGLQQEPTPQKLNGMAIDDKPTEEKVNTPEAAPAVKRKAPTSAFSDSSLSDISDPPSEGEDDIHSVDTPATAPAGDMDVDEKSPSKPVRRSTRATATPTGAKSKPRPKRGSLDANTALTSERRQSARIKKQRVSLV